MKAVSLKNKCFAILENELEGRLDPCFYKPEFIKIDKTIKRAKHKKIKEISLDLKNGSTPRGGIFEEKGIPYFRSQDFNLFDFKIRQYISPEFHKKISRSSIKGKDVLIAVVGATLGVVGYVPDYIKEGNINQNVARIRVIDKEINPKYLAIFLASKIGQILILRNATITTQAYLNNKQLGGIEIPILELQTQNRIIKLIENAYKDKDSKEEEAEEILNTIDDYVLEELGIKMPELKDKMCFSVNSKEIVNSRLDGYYYQLKFKEIENAFVKGKYKITEFKDIIKNINYGTIPKKYSETGIPLLKIGNLKPNEIITTKLSYVPNFPEEKDKKKIARKGDLLISQLGTVGITAPVVRQEEGFLYGSFILRVQISQGVPMYFSIILNSPIGKIQFQRNMTTATVRANTSIPDVKNLKIPLPPLAIQNKIANEVKSRLEKAKKLKSEAKNIIKEAKKQAGLKDFLENLENNSFI